MFELGLGLDWLQVTQEAALASADWVAKGDEKAADQAAVAAMRRVLGSLAYQGVVVIGEGERDQAPMLFIGEEVGRGGPAVDIALDPLEGTTLCARGDSNAICVLAVAPRGCLLHAPDVYMEKIAVGPEAKGAIDLQRSPKENLIRIAKQLKCSLAQLKVGILDRPRHASLIAEVRATGARVRLIRDGDVSLAMATCRSSVEDRVDVLMGTGGAPEGVLAAAALKCLGGDFQGRLVFSQDSEKKRAAQMGIRDCERIYELKDLVLGEVIFCATGVTSGQFLQGVSMSSGCSKTSSVLLNSAYRTISWIQTEHPLQEKTHG